VQRLQSELRSTRESLQATIEELERSNGDVQSLLQSTRIPTLCLTDDLRIHKFTRATTELFRLIDADIGRPITDIAARIANDGLEADVRDVLSSLSTRQRLVEARDREGWFLRRVAPYCTLDDVVRGVVITFVDVTDLKRSQAREAELTRIVDSSNEAIVATNARGEIVQWSEGAARLFGWTAAEAIGRPSTLTLPPDRREEEADIGAKLARGEPIKELETERLCKDGTRIDVSITFLPIRPDLHGAIVRDISKRKRAERDLQAANEALKRSNENLQQLSYAASHDLQEPLRMISNYVQLLTKSHAPALDEKGRLFMKNIAAGTSRLDALLRALQRYWSSERKETAKLVDSKRVLDAALHNLEQAIEEARAEVTVGDLPTIAFAEIPLVEIFQNLVGNAIKYRRPGTRPRIHVDARLQGGLWEFSVADDGPGVPSEHRESIFLPFKRLHGQDIPGHGMGLAIASRIVASRGGRMWVTSDEKGATFRFTIPAEP